MQLKRLRSGKKGLRIMLRDKLLMQIALLAGEELAEADKIYSQFHSPHEAWGVMAEEYDEASEAFKDLADSMKELWQGIKHDMNREADDSADVYHAALLTAAECVQVMAMCTKLKKSRDNNYMQE